MEIPFIKMHGIGNDYVYINGFEFDISSIKNIGDVAQKISHRHFGLGSDGLVLMLPSDSQSIRMQMFNPDGTEAEMCGNAVRCVGGYAYNHNLIKSINGEAPKQFTIETLAGTIGISIQDDGLIEVDMGKPITIPEQIPVALEGNEIIEHEIKTDDFEGTFTAVSMGNPHAVYFVNDVSVLNLEKIGPDLEHHKFFPNRINSEFIEIITPTEVNFRVWERGAGETWACGTGASAALIAGNMTQKLENEVLFHLKGGDLKMKTTPELDRVWKIGPYVEVATGIYNYQI